MWSREVPIGSLPVGVFGAVGALVLAACASADGGLLAEQADDAAVFHITAVVEAGRGIPEEAKVEVSQPGEVRRGDIAEHTVTVTLASGDNSLRITGLRSVDKVLASPDGQGSLRVAGRCAPPPPNVICTNDMITVGPGESRGEPLRLFVDDVIPGSYSAVIPLWSAAAGPRGEDSRRLPEPPAQLRLTYLVQGDEQAG